MQKAYLILYDERDSEPPTDEKHMNIFWTTDEKHMKIFWTDEKHNILNLSLETSLLIEIDRNFSD